MTFIVDNTFSLISFFISTSLTSVVISKNILFGIICEYKTITLLENRTKLKSVRAFRMSESCLSANCSSYLSGPIGQSFTTAVQFLYAAQCLLDEDWPEDSTNKLTDLTFDYIVIGAGTAGSVVASRLSEDKHRRVLLVEAGGNPPLESVVVSGSTVGTNYDWKYRTENDSKACQGCVDGRCNWPRGKMLGGSSSMNGMIYIRGHYKNYDELEKAGNTGWNSDVALQYFKKSENLSEARLKNNLYYSKYHNFDGLLDVTSYGGTHPFRKYLIKSLNEIGSKEVEDISDLKPYGTVQALGTIKGGKRESTATAFLISARYRDNLMILKNALATKIVFNGKTAIGVNIILFNNTEIVVKATIEVILSGGVVNTPQLLMLSGIGPKKHLEDMRVPLIADLAVGKNLHDHIFLPTPIIINKGIPIQSQTQDVLDAAEYLTFQKGPYSQRNINDITSFFKVNKKLLLSLTPPDIQFQQTYYARNSNSLIGFCKINLGFTNEICNFLKTLNNDNDILIVSNALLNVKSRGRIELASNNPLDHPKIYPNYFSSTDDVDNIIKGIDIVSSLIATPTMKSLGSLLPRINISVCNNLTFKSKDYWQCIIFHMGLSYYHQMGTAKMGPDSDPEAVVDPYCRVHGINNLRVVDASVFPGTISGNTNAPTIMLAERVSDLIKEAHSKD